MKRIILALFFISSLSGSSFAQKISDDTRKTSDYLEKIRGNESLLMAFFHQMPKGGDLHHHFSGAIYAETFFDTAVAHHFLLDTSALIVYPPGTPVSQTVSVVPFDSIRGGKRAYFKDRLIRLWSVKDFGQCDGANDAHFFNTFGLFGPTIAGSEASMLNEIKQRAISEHTDYIETMFIRPSMPARDPSVARFFAAYDPRLETVNAIRDPLAAARLLETMYTELHEHLGADSLASMHHDRLVRIYHDARLHDGNDSGVVIRFLNYITRVSTPADVFAQLYLSFASCDMDSLVVGVNIVAPENSDISLRDYWIHMQMFKFFRSKFPNVHTAMHAGELVLGMVKPEELTWHISEAVREAGAERIGHGVDIAYELNAYDLLKEMSRKHIAVEINLTSNEFILHAKNSIHPVSLYGAFGVPIVISTDDPGVLRSDHTGEFVKLAYRYPQFTYADIKKIVYNSIEYSFLGSNDKQTMKRRLDQEFVKFESQIVVMKDQVH